MTDTERQLTWLQRYIQRAYLSHKHGFYARVAYSCVFHRRQMLKCFGRDDAVFHSSATHYDAAIDRLKRGLPFGPLIVTKPGDANE